MSRKNLNSEESAPLSHITYQILLALADQDLHGYGIIKEVAERANGAIELETGTLYAAIKRLREDKILGLSPRKPEPGEDARRRYYCLTKHGLTVLRNETLRLQELIGVAQQKHVIA